MSQNFFLFTYKKLYHFSEESSVSVHKFSSDNPLSCLINCFTKKLQKNNRVAFNEFMEVCEPCKDLLLKNDHMWDFEKGN